MGDPSPSRLMPQMVRIFHNTHSRMTSYGAPVAPSWNPYFPTL
jgi:hypothetical protein